MRVNPKFPLSSQFPGSTEYRAPIGHHIHLTTRPPLFRITVKFDLQTRVSRTISCPFPRVPRAPSPPDPVFSIACTPVLHCLCRYTRKLAGVSVCTNGSIGSFGDEGGFDYFGAILGEYCVGIFFLEIDLVSYTILTGHRPQLSSIIQYFLALVH